MDRELGEGGWHWWLKVGLIALASVGASLLILFGAVRFLDQAQREHDRVECLRSQVQAMAQSGAEMGQVVLNPRNDLPTRQAAFVAWSAEQGRAADRIGRC